MKRAVVQNDINNIQERLNEMLISVPALNDNETLSLPTEQTSTTQYFTPKISMDENGKKKIDEHENYTDNDNGDGDPYRN